MSFKNLKVEQLRKIAEGFNVEVDEKANKATLLAAIEEDEYTNYDDAVQLLKTEGAWDETDEAKAEKDKEKARAEKEAEPKDTLLKMKRANRSYEIIGYRFTREHPFSLVTAKDAETITDLDPDGFVYATPKEAREFYG